jgi:hypothetical protein
MAGPRDPRFTPRPAPPSAAHHGPERPPVRPVRSRPDPNPMRLMLGLAGLASASALTAAMVPSIAPAPAAASVVETAAGGAGTGAETAAVTPVRRVTRYVVLAPGQTPPPGAAVQAQPKPTPIVKVEVVTRSRQSGQP